MDALLKPVADAAGASLDQIKLIACLLVAYPLGSVYIRIPSSSPALRHLFSIVVALFFFFPVLQLYSGFAQLLGSILATYYIAKYNHGPSMPWMVFFTVVGHLLVNHVIRIIYNLSYETMDVTGPQMVLTMKLSTFAWNVYDGRRAVAELDAWQASKRVTQFPSLLEFLGYSLYFPGVLVGPYVIFSDYMDLVNDTLFKKGIKKEDGSAQPKRLIPKGRKRVAYAKMWQGLFYLALFATVGSTYNFAAALKPEFTQMPYWKRVFLFQIYGVLERSKYYFLWTLTEGASILTGLGFSGFSASGASQWEGCANIIPFEVELPSNFKVLLDCWNMKTNIWLRECMYKRVTPKGKKPGFQSTILTALTSAVWHGVSAGYYLTFFLGGFITSLGRMGRANFRPLVAPVAGQTPSFAKRLYDLAVTTSAILLLNYAASPFMLLSLRSSIKVWTALNWYGHIMLAAGYIFFYAGGARFCRRLQAKQGISSAKSGTVSGTATPVNEKTGFNVAPVDAFLPAPQK